MTDLHNQLKGFLSWYEDLYGKELYIEKPINPLADFREQISNCQKCPLHKTRTNFVFGEGHENADIMFIGEAPGVEEDRQGRPFVGRSGQLLNKLLANFGLTREDVFIANILKSRPPNNRDPRPDEVEACIPYLHRQIELIQPKLLIALGRIAGQNLLNNRDALGAMRKQRHLYHKIPLFVTFHPAYILRNMNAFEQIMEDFRWILTHLEQQK